MSIFQKLQAQQLGLEDVSDVEEMTHLEIDITINQASEEISEAEEDADVAEIVVAQAETGVEQLTYLYEAIKGQALTAREAMLAAIGAEAIIVSNNLGSSLASDLGELFGSENFSSRSQCEMSTQVGLEKMGQKISAAAKAVWDKIIAFFKKMGTLLLAMIGGVKGQKARLAKLKEAVAAIKSEGKVVSSDVEIAIPASLAYKGSVESEKVIAGVKDSVSVYSKIIDGSSKALVKGKSSVSEIVKTESADDRAKMIDDIKLDIKADSGFILSGEKSAKVEADGTVTIQSKTDGKAGKAAPFTVYQLETCIKIISDAFVDMDGMKETVKVMNDTTKAIEVAAKAVAEKKYDDEKGKAAIKDAQKAAAKLQNITVRGVVTSIKGIYALSKDLMAVSVQSVSKYKTPV